MFLYKSTQKTQSHTNFDITKILKPINIFIVQPYVEIYDAIVDKRFPYLICLFITSFFHLVNLLNIDKFIVKTLFHIDYQIPDKIYFAYCTICILTGPYLWGLFQVALRQRLIKRLTAAFKDAGLKSPTGRLPSFILDKSTGTFTRFMRLARNGFSLKQFQEAKDRLQSDLQLHIEDIIENRSHGTVDIIYSTKELEKLFKPDGLEDVGQDTFLVGRTIAETLKADLSQVPHYLVAGASGGGKSTFLNQMITTLYLNNKDYQFCLIDLKGGVEFQLFRGLPSRVEIAEDPKDALEMLSSIVQHEFKKRYDLLKENECQKIEQLFTRPTEQIKFPESWGENKKINRIVVVVDETFDLFLSKTFLSADERQDAKLAAIKIASKGRAIGCHLILATQRPDRFAIDPSIKGNLAGKICFRMPDQASSRIVLDRVVAANLPKISGRAIWDNGDRLEQVQAPFVPAEQIQRLLKPYKVKNSPKIKQQKKDMQASFSDLSEEQ